jgi:hypothetical protein
MSKTPLQTAIEQIEQEIDKWQPDGNLLIVRGALLTCRDICTTLLPNEREVIEEAYEAGVEDERRFNKGYMFEADKFVYFTTKFNGNERNID